MKTNQHDTSVLAWWKQGLTQAAMAERLGITRQRVQQIERRLGLDRRHVPGERTQYIFKCMTCRKESSSLVNGRKYCSRSCFVDSRRKIVSVEEQEIRRKKNRARAHSYYHDVFKKRKDWRQIVRERNLRYAQGRMGDKKHRCV